MKNHLTLFFIVTVFAHAAYNPFFDNSEASPKVIQSTIVPANISSLNPQTVFLGGQNTQARSQIIYFGFIEAQKGKYALMKVNNDNIIVKENNKIYINNQLFYVREISSNAIFMETETKQVKTIYFSGETDGQRR